MSDISVSGQGPKPPPSVMQKEQCLWAIMTEDDTIVICNIVGDKTELVAVDEDVVPSLVALATRLATSRKLKLVKFTAREVIQEIEGRLAS